MRLPVQKWPMAVFRGRLLTPPQLQGCPEEGLSLPLHRGGLYRLQLALPGTSVWGHVASPGFWVSFGS